MPKKSPVQERFFTRGTIQLRGARPQRLADLYHLVVSARWSRFIPVLMVTFLLANGLFAAAYRLTGGIQGADPESYWDAFFFSVQTLATIGYGAMSPVSLAAHLLVTIETMVGMLGMAMATGLVFAKFSRPRARVLFSKVAVIAPRDGVPTLMFRVANERGNHIAEAQMRVALLRTEVTVEGETLRRLHDLALLRSQSPAFILTWMAMHPIVPGSPLFGASSDSLQAQNAEIIVTLNGVDDTLSQTIHARHSYLASELVFGARLADILSSNPDGKRVIDLTKFHDTVPLDAPKKV